MVKPLLQSHFVTFRKVARIYILQYKYCVNLAGFVNVIAVCPIYTVCLNIRAFLKLTHRLIGNLFTSIIPGFSVSVTSVYEHIYIFI